MSKVLHVRVVNVDGVLETVQALVPRGPFGQTKAKVSEMKIPLIISIQKKASYENQYLKMLSGECWWTIYSFGKKLLANNSLVGNVPFTLDTTSRSKTVEKQYRAKILLGLETTWKLLLLMAWGRISMLLSGKPHIIWSGGPPLYRAGIYLM